MIHSILTSRRAIRHKNGAILRVCWETNGSSNPDLLRAAVDIALESGGCIKFDLKAWDENLHKALCGVTNSRTLANLRETAQYALRRRPDPPPVVASTLLVPGYVDEHEVHNIARHVAQIDRDIPYSLLAFYPSYCMDDLPTTSISHASRCMEAAEAAGLRNVHLGNRHLLGPDYG
jgi:pyruvate formate lyase activating enzyme